jgi:energy-coupling factor transport system permease protein
MNINPLAWLAWTLGAAAVTLADRNPFVQLLMLLVIGNLWLVYRGKAAALYWRAGLLLAILPVLFSVALSRYGAHVIVSLPPIPVVGGHWTLEALLFGISSGIALLLTVGVFALLHATVRSADVLQVLPPPLYRLGSVVGLALTLVPQTIRSAGRINEARRLRGGRSGWRSVPMLLVPLLLTTLESSLQYAESLDARGFGSGRRSRYRNLKWGIEETILTLCGALALWSVAFAPAPAFNPYNSLIPLLPSAVSLGAVLPLSIPALLATFQHAPDRV